MKLTRRIVLGALLIGCVAVWFYLMWLERSYGLDAENFTRIQDGLYMGGSVEKPPPGTRAVLNLCSKADPYQCEVHKAEAIRDAEPVPSIDWLRQMVEFIDKQRRAGRPVYVHCRNGVSRSGMVVTAYLMFKNNWSRDQALAFIRTKREIVRPHSAFMKFLLEWEAVLKEPPTDGKP